MQTGKALDLYRAPKDILAARTVSDLNELPARIEHGTAKTALGSFPANGVGEGADAIVCVRQRGVRLLARARACRRACSMRASSATWRFWRSRCRRTPRSLSSKPRNRPPRAPRHVAPPACERPRFAAIVLGLRGALKGVGDRRWD
ncbi:MAG: hypothetical protein ACLQF1_11275 [Methyloceanibacter sp.]